MTLDKILHSRTHIDRQYVSRKEGEGSANIEYFMDTSIWRLEDYIKKKKD